MLKRTKINNIEGNGLMELFLQMPMWLQIFCTIAMLVGLIVMWRFKYIIGVVSIGAIALFKSITAKKQ